MKRSVNTAIQPRYPLTGQHTGGGSMVVGGGDDLDVSMMIGSHDFVVGLLPPRLGSSKPRSAANAGIDCFLWGMSCGSDKTILAPARTACTRV